MKNFARVTMMLLLFAMAFLVSPHARSQAVLLTESWENGGVIPAGFLFVAVMCEGSVGELAVGL